MRGHNTHFLGIIWKIFSKLSIPDTPSDLEYWVWMHHHVSPAFVLKGYNFCDCLLAWIKKTFQCDDCTKEFKGANSARYHLHREGEPE